MKKVVWILLSCIVLYAQESVLSASRAFQFDIRSEKNRLEITLNLQKGIYLYKEALSFTLEPSDIVIERIEYPLAKDHDGVSVLIPMQKIALYLQQRGKSRDVTSVTLHMKYQGCSEEGVCYKPSEIRLSTHVDKQYLSSVSTTSNKVDEILRKGNIFYIIGSFFVFGLLLSLTPCVFPMLPILSSVIVSHRSELSTKKAFWLSMVYVQAMAFTYTVLGVIIGFVGAGVQQYIQNPIVITTFALLFVLLSLSLFGVFDLQMPHAIQSYLNKQSQKLGKGYLSIVVLGMLSALIIGPCMAAPLAGALGLIAQSGSVFIAAIALYALAMGMGLPLLLVGTSAGKFMPKPGRWMESVKYFFAVVMLGLALVMLQRILDLSLMFFLWGILSLFVSISFGLYRLHTEGESLAFFSFKKTLSILLFLLSLMLLFASITGMKDPFNTWNGYIFRNNDIKVEKKAKIETIHSLRELESVLAASKGKRVIVDFYASWCSVCKKVEESFADEKVQEALKGYRVIRADVSLSSDESNALANRFSLFGPPALIFFDANGTEIKALRHIGYISPLELRDKLQLPPSP